MKQSFLKFYATKHDPKGSKTARVKQEDEADTRIIQESSKNFKRKKKSQTRPN